ncbi:MAG: rRNA pseudouridine synthase [Gammaproteobacteria bacterium]|nr:MAG: rRNA pseudouridine synthase [Gammaproteobacteria bacterium]
MSDPRFGRTTPVPATAAADGERLQKVLAAAGLGSRRDCEQAIRAGRIRVNGRRVAALPCLVRPGQDLIELDGSVVGTGAGDSRARVEYLYLILNKPRGVITTARDPQGRPNVVAMVQPAIPSGSRVYPVGRLDADSSGLVLLTNDGELTWRLTHPSQEIRKEYLVTLQGRLTPEAIDLVRKGLYLAEPGAGGKTRRAHVEELRVLRQRKDRSQGDQSLVSVTLAEGQNREIRRLFARVGLKVRRLQRQAIGPVRLGQLPEGRFRRLTGAEIAALRRATGLDQGR